MVGSSDKPSGLVVSIVEKFLTGPLSIMLIALSVVLGCAAILLTPREEEPQIVVPMVDISVSYPGYSPEEVEQHVTIPLERLLWQADGVEHVYSSSRRDSSLVTVRFFVGENLEDSLVKVRNQMDKNMDVVPAGVTDWKVTSVEIDDVPVVTLTLFSDGKTSFDLRRLAEEIKAQLSWMKNISKTEILGGYGRQIRVLPDIQSMAARKISLQDIQNALQSSNVSGAVGNLLINSKEKLLIVGDGVSTAQDVRDIIVKSVNTGLVRISDIAEVQDGPEEQANYVNIGFGPAAQSEYEQFKEKRYPAVTIAFSKKKGTNAVSLAKKIISESDKLKGSVVPDDVKMIVTRNYGRTADEKVNNLLFSLLFAIVTVVALISLTMGWREGVVVGLAVPVSFALALFVNYLFGYTINRVTLFALILSLGMVVDDPITNVDNIERHMRLGKLLPAQATLFAVHEVIPPVIMSTLAIIVSFTPMFFITGMMGPYMGPMAINVPLTVTFSTVCALTFVPWLSLKLLKKKKMVKTAASSEKDGKSSLIATLYTFVMTPFLSRGKGLALVLVVLALTIGSVFLMLFKVPLKMLPFDNKNELQVIVEMPEQTTLEETQSVSEDLCDYLERSEDVHDYELYTGINAPIDFNGLVRHYGMRRASNQADIRINLREKSDRSLQSHAIALQIRDELNRIAARRGAVVSIVEVPPGPPVLSTLTIEVMGNNKSSYTELIDGAHRLEKLLRETDSKHIQQIDNMAEEQHKDIVFEVNKEKAMQHGISMARIYDTLKLAVSGRPVTTLHDKREREPLVAQLQLPLGARADLSGLSELWITAEMGDRGAYVQLSELGTFKVLENEQPIYHKDLRRVVFVTAETVGRAPGEIILGLLLKSWDSPILQFISSAFSGNWCVDLGEGIFAEWGGEGEWQITVRVFRDLLLAFAAALVGIYLLLILQTRSFLLPLVIMSAIPLTIIGIAPGFYLLNLISGESIAGYSDPVFFTATGMIGMIALGGIVIRNSVVLIDFIENAVMNGSELKTAILASGAVRFRPIVLTAITTMIGALPITFDPVFSGLAWALIFGLIASTLFTLFIVPVVYFFINKKAN